MSVWGTTVTGTIPAATEFHDFLCSCHNINPPNIQNKCDGCMRNFWLRHTLSRPNGGLIVAHHNDICDEIIHLTEKLSPLTVHTSNLLIHLGHSISEEELCHVGRVPEAQGGVLIQVLWESQTEVIVDARFGYSDAWTWKPVIMDKLLEGWDKPKK